MRMRAWVVPGACLAVLAACSRSERSAPSASSDPSAPIASFQARFAVRGRWAGEREIGYRIEDAGGALDPAAFRTAIGGALAEWEATGCARFHEAHDEAALVFAFERGEHDDGVPFGDDPGLAHAGPVGPGTFVHFDAERTWDEESLRRAALHEVGHVLGLDHSPDEGAIMYPEPGAERVGLGGSDLAGIHSLYGGGEEGAGDLVVSREGVELVLHSVAPADSTEWTAFDTDGDGDQEIVVWSTTEKGRGALWEYHFARGMVLERTVGPLYGVVEPGCEVEFVVGEEGERVVVLEPEHGEAQARALDEAGMPRAFEGEMPSREGVGGMGSGEVRVDVDGDGVVERVRRR